MVESSSIATSTTDSLAITPTTEEVERRGVTFDSIEVREYARCLGNNPATTNGPPLSIDWPYSKVGRFALEEYEEQRPPRRIANEMMIPASLRESIILEQTDATKTLISAMKSEVQAVRHRRQLTVAMQEFEEWTLVFESLRRKFKRFKSGISKKKEEELLWENARSMASAVPVTTTRSILVS